MTAHVAIKFVAENIFDSGKGRWQDGRHFREDLSPGSAHWASDVDEADHAALTFVCPCGCGTTHAVTIRKPGVQPSHPSWQWDGNKDRPSLTPSIQCLTPCRWHGYLTDGEFRVCT